MAPSRNYKGFEILELALGRSLSSGFFYRIVEVPDSWTKRDFDTLEEAKGAIDSLDAPATPVVKKQRMTPRELAAEIRAGRCEGTEGPWTP